MLLVAVFVVLIIVMRGCRGCWGCGTIHPHPRRAVQGEKVLKETKEIVSAVLKESTNATAKAWTMDEKVLQSLTTFPRVVAKQIVEDFVATVDDKVKNPNAWFMGTLKR